MALGRQLLFVAMGIACLFGEPTSGAATEDAMTRGGAALEQGDSSAAVLAFEEALVADRENATAWLGLSAAHELAGRWADALMCARQAADLAPAAAEAQFTLARMLASAGRQQEALAAFSRTREVAPSLAEAYLLPALLLRDAGRAEEALALLAAEAQFTLARMLASAGRQQEALAAFSRTREVAPSLAEAYLLPALLLRDAGRAEEALALLAAGLDASGGPALAEQFAFLALAGGQGAEALTVVEGALEETPERADLLLAKALALATLTERRAEADDWFRRALAAGVSREGRARLEWARLLSDLGRWPDAVSQLQLVTKLLPTDGEGFFRLGAALRQVGELEAAGEALARYQSLNAATVAAERQVREIGTALNEAQELAGADRLDEALERLATVPDGGSDPRVQVLRAKVLFSLGRADEALETAGQAAALAPLELEPSYLEALFAFASDRFERALTAADRTLALDPALGETWALRGSALARLQRLDEAAGSFQRALDAGFDSAAMRLEYAGVLSDLGQLEESRRQLEARERLTGG